MALGPASAGHATLDSLVAHSLTQCSGSIPVMSTTSTPHRRPCWHCRSFLGFTAQGSAARCGRQGCSAVRASPARGCSCWEREPGTDDDDVDNPPSGYRGDDGRNWRDHVSDGWRAVQAPELPRPGVSRHGTAPVALHASRLPSLEAGPSRQGSGSKPVFVIRPLAVVEDGV
jgi:hypothetical protein